MTSRDFLSDWRRTPPMAVTRGVSDPECVGWPLPDAVKSLILARRGDRLEAELAAWIQSGAEPYERFRRSLLAADVRLHMGLYPEGLVALRLALGQGREAGRFDGVLREAPETLARLCAEALEAGIEPCYAHRLIEANALRPPARDLAHWPYPLRIHTLGRTVVLVRGQPLRLSGKAQRRPMLLLHCLLARGGRAVPVSLLRGAMGESADEGDGHYSRGAFDMALSRLRALLVVPDAILLGDGLLSLNEDLCWVDAWACERLLLRVDAAVDPESGLALLEKALDLYEGDFLEGEDTAWTLLARERLRARLLRVARRLGASFEAAGRWASAGALYARLREFFPLDEDLCLHLIRSHVRRDEFAQARGIYTRCRDLLAKVLGVLPGPEIRALVEAPTH